MKSFFPKSLLALAIVCSAALVLFTQCKEKDEEITTIITVKARWDTLLVMPFADVTIGKDFNDVKVQGKTDATGQFKATFTLEAILEVLATKDTNTGTGPIEQALQGTAVVRLKPGETAYKTVFIR